MGRWKRQASWAWRGLGHAGAPLLGLCGVVLIWAAVLHSLSAARQQAVRHAEQATLNLSRAFEEHIIRSLKSVDQTLLYIRESYQKDPAGFDVAYWTRSTQALTDLTFQITLIDREGLVIGSNLLAGKDRVDLSDREHFKVHRDGAADALFVSKPVLGRVSGRWSIQLTRRMSAPDGAFAGVIVVSLDPQYLSRFYQAVDLGRNGSVDLIGLDGIVRAHAAAARTPGDAGQAVGQSVLGSALLERFARSGTGSIRSKDPIDGVPRIVSFHGVRGYPLLVSVGVAEGDILEPYAARRRSDLVSAGMVSAVLLFVTALVVVRRKRLTHARRQLRISEAMHVHKSRLFEATLEHISQGIMMIDAFGRVQVCNHQAVRQLGLPPEMLARRPMLEDVVQWQWEQGEFGDGGQAVTGALRDFIRSGGISQDAGSYERVRPDGTVLEIRSLPMAGGGFVRTYTDITRNKEYEATLLAARENADKAAQAKSDFLAMMSHEIRSPMSGLVGAVELLRGTALNEDQARMAGMALHSAQTLLAVLNDILDFSKIEAGALSITCQPTSLRAMVNGAVTPHQIEAARKGVVLGIEFDPAVPDWVETDSLRVQQILHNLLSNAVKFTLRGSIRLRVQCSVQDEGGMLAVSVADSGIGMSADVISRLFAPFMQADGSTTRVFGGTGLGLCISRRLAELLGGTLSAVSSAGNGSTFTLRLPLATASSRPARTDDDLASSQGAAMRGRVLIADDDPTNRWLSQRQLETLGFVVETAGDGVTALAALHGQPFDLLVTDCHMPGMDGVTLARCIRQFGNDALSSIPIIGLTADVTAAQRARCHDAGMTEVAIKPLSRQGMVRLLSQVLPATRTPHDRTVPAMAPAMAPGDDDGAVFNPEMFFELFAPDTQDGIGWLEEYLDGAAAMQTELDQISLDASGGSIDAETLTAVAHRLAGSSLAVGAERLGRAAARLEQAGPPADPAGLNRNRAAVARQFTAARDAIRSFASGLAAGRLLEPSADSLGQPQPDRNGRAEKVAR